MGEVGEILECRTANLKDLSNQIGQFALPLPEGIAILSVFGSVVGNRSSHSACFFATVSLIETTEETHNLQYSYTETQDYLLNWLRRNRIVRGCG